MIVSRQYVQIMDTIVQHYNQIYDPDIEVIDWDMTTAPDSTATGWMITSDLLKDHLPESFVVDTLGWVEHSHQSIPLLLLYKETDIGFMKFLSFFEYQLPNEMLSKHHIKTKTKLSHQIMIE